MSDAASNPLMQEHCRRQAALGAVILLSMLIASVLGLADCTTRLLAAGVGCALLTGATLPYGLEEGGSEHAKWKKALLYAGVLFLTGALGLPTIAIVQQYGV
jgi:hypothetical protein